jgi:hypothetical protein
MRNRLLIIVALVLSMNGCSKHQQISQLDFPPSGAIIISAERFPDDTQPIYYQVNLNGRTVVPRTYILSEEPDRVKNLRFNLVKAQDGKLVGVTEEKFPQKVWAMYNTVTGETWPRCESGGVEACERRGKLLLNQLQKDHPEAAFTL